MRKFFLSFLALTIAVSASAFTLQLQEKDDIKTITSATPSSDLFGDGTVAVAFDNTAKTVYVTLKDAHLFNSASNDYCPFLFQGDISYEKLCIKLEGYNMIRSIDGAMGSAMHLRDCEADIISSSTNDTLYVRSRNFYPIDLQGSVTLNIGNRERGAFGMTIDTKDYNCIKANNSFATVLSIYSVQLYLKTDDRELVDGFKNIYLKYNQPLESSVELTGNMFWNTKYDREYTGSLVIPAPYPIFFGEEPIFAENAEDFKPL